MGTINIGGNLESLKKSIINELEGLFDLDISKDEFLSEELALKLVSLTGRINREIAVYVDKKGSIIDVSVGDNSTVSLPYIEGRRGRTGLSGIRCIHTHPNGDGMLSSVDISSLVSLRLDAMIAIGAKGEEITEIYAALLFHAGNGEAPEAEIFGPFGNNIGQLNSHLTSMSEMYKGSKRTLHVNEEQTENAILVGLERGPGRVLNGKSEGERSLEELEELALTAGVTIVHRVLQKRPVKDAAYYIGKGMVESLSLMRQAFNADLIIFDDELSGAQVRNIEDCTGARVIDRTVLILDIFAQRARSREGKLQVELAQLKYRLPRLIGLGSQLSRLGGGIGTRGPGEKKLEVDRRHIRRRITYLENELGNLSKRRDLQREDRKKDEKPVVALVGYTNAGKSTLMNKLCNSDVFAENKLFATLDPTTRGFSLPDGRNALLIDTVGFIRKLPHELVEAFKSTLEEAVFADVLIHVVDASSEEADEQVRVVNELLSALGVTSKPIIMVLNKIDLVGGSERISIGAAEGKLFEVSAVSGEGVSELLDGIVEAIPGDEEEMELYLPYSEGWAVPYIHDNGRVLSEKYEECGIIISAVVKKTKSGKLRKYLVEKQR